MFRVMAQEFVYFGVTFGVAVLVWTAAIGSSAPLLALVAAVVAGLFGSLRGALILNAKRGLYREELSAYPEEVRKDLEQPSAWQLKSSLTGVAGFSTLLGFIVWGIRSLL